MLDGDSIFHVLATYESNPDKYIFLLNSIELQGFKYTKQIGTVVTTFKENLAALFQQKLVEL